MIEFFKDVKTDILNDAFSGMFNDNIVCRLTFGYEFDEDDIIDNINSSIFISDETVGSYTILNYIQDGLIPNRYIFELPQFRVKNVPIHKAVNGIIIYQETTRRPLFYISDLVGMPLLTLGGDINVDFSAIGNKFFSIDLSTEDVFEGSHFISSEGGVNIQQRTNTVYRHGQMGDKTAEPVAKAAARTKQYTDIIMSGITHPLTGDIAIVSNTNSVNQSIRNILLTNTGERPFSSYNVAGNLIDYLFESTDIIDIIERNLKNVLEAFEPRIIIDNLEVISFDEDYAISINIRYTIKGTLEKGNYTQNIERS